MYRLEINHGGKVYVGEILNQNNIEIIVDLINHSHRGNETIIINRNEDDVYKVNDQVVDLELKENNLSTFDHTGAFVLPYIHQNAEIYFYLGRETSGPDKDTYDSFGGHRDLEDADSLYTASRELWEEGLFKLTFGVEIDQMIEYVRENTNEIVALYDNEKKDVLYVTEFSEMAMKNFVHNYFKSYNIAIHEVNKVEKDYLAKVRKSELRDAVNSFDNHIQVEAEVYDLQGNVTFQTITLRPVLSKLLRALFGIYTSLGNEIRFCAT